MRVSTLPWIRSGLQPLSNIRTYLEGRSMVARLRQKLMHVPLEVKKITQDVDIRPRAEWDEELAREYGEIMRDNGTAALPAVTIFYDGEDYWLADGFLRVDGASMFQIEFINAEVHQGSRRDALL